MSLPSLPATTRGARPLDTAPVNQDDHNLQIYTRGASSTPLLGLNEERRLAGRIRRGDQQALDPLVRADLRLVIKIAQDYANLGLPPADLIAEGNIGMLTAARRFDSARGAKFSTYAAFWIRQEIRRGLSSRISTVCLPVHVREKTARARRVTRMLAAEPGREPGKQEVAEATGIAVRTLDLLGSISAQPLSMDAAVDDEGNSTLESLLADAVVKGADEQLVMKETPGQIGAGFGVTRERIRHIQNSALKKMRCAFDRANRSPLSAVPERRDFHRNKKQNQEQQTRKSLKMKMLTMIPSPAALAVCLLLAMAPGAVLAKAPSESIRGRLSVDPTPPERTGPLAGYSAIVDKVAPGIVSILTSSPLSATAGSMGGLPFRGMDPFGSRGAPRQAPEVQGLGSGVILTADGYLVTNNHVVENATEIRVALPDNRREYKAEIVGRDPQTDVAVLKINAGNLPTATLGDSSTLKVGDTVLAIGSPFGLSKTVTSGIVSAIGRSDVGIFGYENFIQTDASINPGNSGGALLDNKGRVVGINTAIFSGTGGNVGIGFAIPVNMVTHVVEQLIDKGEIERGYLGVLLGQLSPELAAALDVPGEGVLVNEVVSGTPAAAAGMRDGDVITAIDGQPAVDVSKLRLEVSNRAPGSKAVFSVTRDGKAMEVSVEIGRLPAEGVAALAPGAFGRPQTRPSPLLDGLEAANLGAAEHQRFGIPENVQGIVVTRVEPGSKAAEAGLRPGDVITEVARQPVADLGDALAAKANARNGTLLLRVANGEGSRFVAVPLA